jgi:pyrimidine deaminase RibD-like protein/CheY-like chemotaxis protein
MRILWVEDVFDEVEPIAHALLRAGHEIVTARDAGEAGTILQNDITWDLVLLDSYMQDPDLQHSHSGCKFFRDLRSGRWGDWGRSVPVLFITGFAQTVSRKIGGINPAPLKILGKPLGRNEGLRELGEVLPELRIVANGSASVFVNIQIHSEGASSTANRGGDPKSAPAQGTVNSDDRRWIELAIAESRKCVSEDERVHPVVGVVVVKDGELIATAYRGESGPGNHAEYCALERALADEIVAGATVYTTLEPCTTRNHPKVPCAERLIERKVARVVIGMLDPNPSIRGHGFQRLRQANIITEVFPADLMTIVEDLNHHFTRLQLLQSRPS